MLVISLVHTQALLLVYSGKTDWKAEGLVSRNSECCIPCAGLSYKCYKEFRKMVERR